MCRFNTKLKTNVKNRTQVSPDAHVSLHEIAQFPRRKIALLKTSFILSRRQCRLFRGLAIPRRI